MEKMECSIVEVVLPLLIFKVGVLFNYGASLCFVSLLALQTFWETFLAKNNVRSTPASLALKP